MLSVRSCEVLLAFLVLLFLQYKPLLPVRVCLLLVSRDANTWTAKSPMGATHLLRTLVFSWLSLQTKPDWTSHSVCSKEGAGLSLVGLLLQQACVGSLRSWELTGCTSAHTQCQKFTYHCTQSTSDMHCCKVTGMGPIYASAPAHSPSEQSQVAFWETPRKAEFLRLPKRFIQIQSDTLLGCFSHYLSSQ